MTYAQCIEARRLLGLTQAQLAVATGIRKNLISAFESTGYLPKARVGDPDRGARLKLFFEEAGLEFTNKVPAGVRLRSPDQ